MSDAINHNPDILTCLANLSNDEVFTPPELANKMLDLMPEKFWKNPNVKVLDPACKSGVFLREAAKRFIKGLEPVIPDLQKRLDHIFHNQLFGYAITELTSYMSRRSLYCSKFANGPYSVSHFNRDWGNINFRRVEHTWNEKSCIYCGATKEVFNRGKDYETYAYKFIHLDKKKLKELQNMKFDLIISNPPYQLNDNGNGQSAKPIYQYFIETAIKLNPKYMTMIIPSRWYSGGKGLNSFREKMLEDKRIRKLVDFENFRDVFPGVDLAGGVCYFLWDRDNKGLCEVTNINGTESNTIIRDLNQYDTFIRQNLAVNIVEKIRKNYTSFLSAKVSSRKPFGLPTNYTPYKSGVPCYFIQKIGRKYANESDIKDENNYLDKWKFIAPKSPIAGQTDFTKPVGFYYDGNTKIIEPGTCCTESFIILGAFNTEKEAIYYRSYIYTKTVRFLLLQTVVSQDVTKKNFSFIPDLGTYDKIYTDEMLCNMWNLTKEEWEYIDSRIHNYENSVKKDNEENSDE